MEKVSSGDVLKKIAEIRDNPVIAELNLAITLIRSGYAEAVFNCFGEFTKNGVDFDSSLLLEVVEHADPDILVAVINKYKFLIDIDKALTDALIQSKQYELVFSNFEYFKEFVVVDLDLAKDILKQNYDVFIKFLHYFPIDEEIIDTIKATEKTALVFLLYISNFPNIRFTASDIKAMEELGKIDRDQLLTIVSARFRVVDSLPDDYIDEYLKSGMHIRLLEAKILAYDKESLLRILNNNPSVMFSLMYLIPKFEGLDIEVAEKMISLGFKKYVNMNKDLFDLENVIFPDFNIKKV